MTAPVTLLQMPAPDPYTGVDACPTCGGAKITGVLFRMPLPKVRNVPGGDEPSVLVVDELCPGCGGCGRDRDHATCTPPEHAGWRADDDDQAAGCRVCGGRQWFSVRLFDDDVATDARVPCGCAETLLQAVDASAGAGGGTKRHPVTGDAAAPTVGG